MSRIKIVIKHKKAIVALVLLLTVIFTICFFKVKINYNMTDYLPENANSTIALDTLQDEFGEAIPNCNVMISDVSIERGIEIKQELEKLSGISHVSWVDDMVDVKQPLEVQNQDMIEEYYKDENALFSVTIEDGMEKETTDLIKEAFPESKISGTAVEQADSQRLASTQTMSAICVLGPLIILILILVTTSWIEPFIYLTAIGAAVLVNLGSEIFRGEISYVTLAVVPILQMAVSLDYAVFLSSSFAKYRKIAGSDAEAMKYAMKDSVKSIAASALTTIFGFFALTLMNFKIGPDMGIGLVKGVILSFVFCMTFLPAMILLLNKCIDRIRHKSFLPDFKGAGKVAVKIRIPIFIIVAVIASGCFIAQSKNHFVYGSGDAAGNTADARAIEKVFGKTNTMVVMIPNTDRTSEMLLCNEIEEMEHVTSVLSYTTQVGAQIPPEYLSDDIVDKFYGEYYARIIVYSDLPDESEVSFALVKNIRKAAQNYYGDEVLSCGQSANLYDMKTTVEDDNTVVSMVTVVAIFLILAIMMKSWLLPILLILTIKIAIWINMAIPFFTDSSLVYIGYLVVSTVQMGATIDYAILLTDYYMANRRQSTAKKAMEKTMGEIIPSVLISASILAIAGFALAIVSSNEMVTALGILIGRGALIPLILVNIFLPALLLFTDKLIPCTTWKAGFYKGKENKEEKKLESMPETVEEEDIFAYVDKSDKIKKEVWILED